MLLSLAFVLILLAYKGAHAQRPLSHRLLDGQMLSHGCLLGKVGGEDESGAIPKWFCELDPRDADGMEGIILPVQGLELTEEEESQVDRQPMLSFADGCFVDDSIIVIPDGVKPELQPASGSDAFQLRPTPMGQKKVLIIRVSANDIQPSNTAEQLSDEAFGTKVDPFNMVTQYDDCSYGKFTLSPFDGAINNVNIVGGVYETALPIDASGVNRFVLERQVTTQIAQELGPTWRTDAEIDFVMYCLPTRDFTAYGYFSSFLTVYSDGWCTAPSGHMHELGHNLNLRHSNEGGVEYADQSCLMGFSYPSEDDSPAMCFNGPKSWALGWYSDRHTNIDGKNEWEGYLVGIDDYENSAGTTVVLRIEQQNALEAYYVMFNHADGINAGVKEAGNQVLVTSQREVGQSSLLAKLNAGEEYTIENFDGSDKDLTIRVENIDLSSDPARAMVVVIPERDVEECLTTVLWNADDDIPVATIASNTDTGVVDVFCKQDWEFNVEAKVDCRNKDEIESIIFEFSGPNKFYNRMTERTAPWFAFGDDYRLVKGIDMRIGTYTVEITINYKKRDAAPYSEFITFEFVDCSCDIPIRPE